MSPVFAIFVILLLVIGGIDGALEVPDHNKSVGGDTDQELGVPLSNGTRARNNTFTAPRTTPSTITTTDDYDDGGGSINRIGFGYGGCSKDNILVFQGPTSPLPNGVPTYPVQIQNVCLSSSCSISNIHLNCGWFSSDRLINPKIFRRVGYDDCLVNDGEPLNPGESLSFQYANIFKYPLAVASVDC